MPSNPNTVLPYLSARTETVIRHALARSLSKLCHELGPQALARKIDCDERTVRNARDELATMKLHTAFNLLAVDEGALDSILAEYGIRAVRIDAESHGKHATTIMTRATADVASATDPDSHGGPSITDHELLEREESVRASHRLTGWMLARIGAIRGIGLRAVS